MLFSRSARQRDMQHLHQQLRLRHRDHHGEGFSSVTGSSPSALGLAVALPGSMQVLVPKPYRGGRAYRGPVSPSLELALAPWLGHTEP